MTERIGVYICHCGSNIASTVDVTELVKYASSIRDVVVARDYRYVCSDPGQDMIKKDIKELGLTRVVVAACSPSMHETTFRRAWAEAGLNPYLFQMANIREQCSWVVHTQQEGTPKAKKILDAAIDRVRLHEPLEVKFAQVTPAVLIVGGGIAGIEAALKIANAGRRVYLVEKEPSIGGHMAQFDKTFPTLDCAACILTPKMVDAARHPFITLLAYSEVQKVSGYVGNFKVKILRKPRYVNEDVCVGCGVCATKCPAKVPSEFDLGLGTRKAIYAPFPQAVPLKYTIDTAHCLWFTKGVCKVCQKFCDAKAVDFEQKPEEVEIEVGAIIIATGFDTFDASRISRYGHGRLENVFTSLEFERLSNASGPTGGRILLKNGKPPESIGIIHCVGSRDENYNEYCSRVCCMYSMKLAHLAKEKTEAEIYEFYIDIRAAGKGYEEFYKRLLREDVTFIRGRAAEVTDLPQSPHEEGKLVITAEDTLLGVVRRIPVDMVILAVGLEPRRDAAQVGRLFTLSRGRDGFFLERHPKLAPVATSTDGIFLAGCAQGPKDIPETVAQGAAAAAEALALLDSGSVPIEPTTAVVAEEVCSGCTVCLSVCPYSAISLDEKKGVAIIQDVLCKGCGLCVVTCPSQAIRQRGFENKQIEAEILTAVK